MPLSRFAVMLPLLVVVGCANTDRDTSPPTAAANPPSASPTPPPTTANADAATPREPSFQSPPATPSPATPPPPAAAAVTPNPEVAAQAAELPHLRINREQRYIDLDATVVLREGDWLELLACSPGSREHESILTVAARPSHIHLALLTLGLEPGKPLTYQETEEGYQLHPPRGPVVHISIVTEADGQTREISPGEWIVNQKTREPLPDDRWLFTGSAFTEYEGKQIYMADLNGTIASLVNFGEDLLARATDLTNQSDDQTWGANTPQIPPLGTTVTLRLRPEKIAPEAAPNAPTP